jgi:hypothetical protein
LVSREAPASNQCSTSRALPTEAAPQCISGRTSYLRVRLAFHPYPPLIRPFCNTARCGRPARVTAPSAWRWVAHPVSGLLPATGRPLRTRFRCGSGCRPLSLAAETQLAGPFYKKYAVTGPQAGSDRPSARGFRTSFTPLAGVLFTFPSRYWYAIGRVVSRALGGGPPRFRPDASCPGVLRPPPGSRPPFAYGALTRSGRPFQGRSARPAVAHCRVGRLTHLETPPTPAPQRQPPWHGTGLGSPLFVRHY